MWTSQLLFPHNSWLFSKWLVISLNEQSFINSQILHREFKNVQSLIMRLLCMTCSLHEQNSKGSLRTLQPLNIHSFVTSIFSLECQIWYIMLFIPFLCHYFRNPIFSYLRTLILLHSVHRLLWPQLPPFSCWTETVFPKSLNLLSLIYHHPPYRRQLPVPRIIVFLLIWC